VLTKDPLNEALRPPGLRTGWHGDAELVDRSAGRNAADRSSLDRHQTAPGLTRRHFGSWAGWITNVQMWTEVPKRGRAAVAKKGTSDRRLDERPRRPIEHSRPTLGRPASATSSIRRSHPARIRARRPGPPGTADCNTPLAGNGSAKRKKECDRITGTRRDVSPTTVVLEDRGSHRAIRIGGRWWTCRAAEEEPCFNGRIPCA